MAIWIFWVVGGLSTIGFVGLLCLMTSNFPVTPTRLDYGRHRQSGTPLYGSSSHLSDFSTGGTSAVGPGENDASTGIAGTGSINSYTGGIASLPNGTSHAQAAAMMQAQAAAVRHQIMQQMMFAHQQQNVFTQQFTGRQFTGRLYGALVPPHNKTSLKSEGVRAGEIIAWRAWRVDGDWLRSASVRDEWDAKEPMRGDASAGFGVHAYKSPHGPMLDGYADHRQEGAWVIGEVALWGDVIEHERGYRAEFGRVHSLVTWSRAVPLDARNRIAAKYLPEPQP